MTNSFYIVYNKIVNIWKNYCSEYFNILIMFIFKVITRMFEYGLFLSKHIEQQSIVLYRYLKQQGFVLYGYLKQQSIVLYNYLKQQSIVLYRYLKQQSIVLYNYLKQQSIVLYNYLKQQSIVLYNYLKQQIINFYNHVIINTAPEIALLEEEKVFQENLQNIRNRRENAPSLWLLKLDFLAFFSILNRLFSILLFMVILFYFSFFFIYNIHLVNTKYIFYLSSLFCLTFFVHIGFNSIKIALIYSNFRKLISNNLLNIQKFYILIYIFLFSFCIFYILLYVSIFFEIDYYIFYVKALFINLKLETPFLCKTTILTGDFEEFFRKDWKHFIICILATQIGYSNAFGDFEWFFWWKLLRYTFIFLFFFILFLFFKYRLLRYFKLNIHTLLEIFIKFSCFCVSLSFILKIYFNNSIHAIIWWYPDIINIKSVDCDNKQKSTLMRNPFKAEKLRVIQQLVDYVKEDSYPLYYLNGLHTDSNEAIHNITNEMNKQQLYLIEDVYAFVAVKMYRNLIYLLQKRVSK